MENDGTSLQFLLAGLVHELNTPLGAIQGNRDVVKRLVEKIADIVADGTVDRAEVEQIRKLAGTLREVIELDQVAVDVISQLVTGVRECWRTDEAEMRCVDLHEGLESTLILLRHEMKHRIELVREYGELPPVRCFPGQMNQVFMNLLLNATQAIEGGGMIRVRTFYGEGQAVVEISDSGSGIAAERLDQVFETGSTAEGTKSGMGLGLRICREIIKRQGGSIEVESTLGEGSTFRVLLPLGGATTGPGS